MTWVINSLGSTRVNSTRSEAPTLSLHFVSVFSTCSHTTQCSVASVSWRELSWHLFGDRALQKAHVLGCESWAWIYLELHISCLFVDGANGHIMPPNLKTRKKWPMKLAMDHREIFHVILPHILSPGHKKWFLGRFFNLLACLCTEMCKIVCTWFGEICSCPCLACRYKFHQTTYKQFYTSL